MPGKELIDIRYGRIAGRFWQSRRKHGWDDTHTVLAAYLLTSDHHHIEGLFRLPISYICVDLGWAETKVRQSLARLQEDRFCFFDEPTETVLLPNALKYQLPKGVNQVKGALRRLSTFEEHRFFPLFLRFAHIHASRDEAFHDELIMWFGPDTYGDYDTADTHPADKYLVNPDPPEPKVKARSNGHLDGRSNGRPNGRSTGVPTLNLNQKLNPNLKLKAKTKTKEEAPLLRNGAPPSLSGVQTATESPMGVRPSLSQLLTQEAARGKP